MHTVASLVASMPKRKTSSAVSREMHRLTWITSRSVMLLRNIRNRITVNTMQKIEMENPTYVIRVSLFECSPSSAINSSCTLKMSAKFVR